MTVYGAGVLLLILSSLYIGGSIHIFQKIFMFLFLSVFFVFLGKKELFLRAQASLAFLAEVSFSIYFIHGYFVGALRNRANIFSISSLVEGVVLGLFFALLFVLAILIFSHAVRGLLKDRSRIIIGS